MNFLAQVLTSLFSYHTVQPVALSISQENQCAETDCNYADNYYGDRHCNNRCY
ncbi:hypothetical protein [Halioxenophilus aromaticivorans]|uniref:Uncharacterized protein n=1 Tax=Halioxenophilus aromaticivorans TaxID=1306992 RepID=A0AAV3U0W9_9ALTE